MAIQAPARSCASTPIPKQQRDWKCTCRNILNSCSLQLTTNDACLESCKKEFGKAVNALNWGSAEEIKKALGNFYSDLYKIIAETPSLPEQLKSGLQTELVKTFKERWVSQLAEDFYSTFSYYDMRTRSLAIEKIAKRLLKEAPLFTQRGISNQSVRDLTEDVEKAFHIYSLECHERVLNSILMDKDKIKQWMKEISRKKEETKMSGFSDEEQVLKASFKLIGPTYIRIFDEINKRREQLRNCVWKEYNALPNKMKSVRPLAKM